MGIKCNYELFPLLSANVLKSTEGHSVNVKGVDLHIAFLSCFITLLVFIRSQSTWVFSELHHSTGLHFEYLVLGSGKSVMNEIIGYILIIFHKK